MKPYSYTILLLVILLALLSGRLAAQTTTFNYTGTVQTYTVPTGISSLIVDVQGAKGGGTACYSTYQSVGGCGGRVQATLVVIPGHVLHIIVGQTPSISGGVGGYGGGGSDMNYASAWPGAGGGGATFIVDVTTGDTLVVAGGGGGGGGDICVGGTGDLGGAGGGLTGGNGNSYVCAVIGGGHGGTSTAGGAGGICGGQTGGAGSFVIGGNCPTGNLGSGGGGGGRYGGGAGAEGGGGGGGSSYTSPVYAAGVTHTQGYNCSSNGTAHITPVCTTAGVITGAGLVCSGHSLSLSDATTGGTWMSSATGVATVSASGVVSGIASGTVLIGYAVGTCTALTTVTVDNLPVAGVISGSSPVCVGAVITLTDTTIGGVWSSSSSTASVSAGGTVTGIAAGTDSIFYSVTNICGTIHAFVVLSVATSTVTAGTIAGSSSVCPMTTISLTDPTGTAGGTWSSRFAGIASVSPSTGVVEGISSGTVDISYIVSTSCGLYSTYTPITVYPLPVISAFSASTNVCVGAVYSVTYSPSGGIWSASNAHASVVGGIVTGVSAGTDSIFYTISTPCGIVDTYLVVTVIGLPATGVITGGTIVCTGASLTLTETVSGGIWSTGNSNATVTSSGIVTGVSAGTDSIFYSVTNTCGTAHTFHVLSVTTSTVTAGTITGSSTVCPMTAITLTDPTGTSGGTWSSSSALIASVTPSSGIVEGISSGTVNISYIVSTSCGLFSTYTPLTVYPLPVVGALSATTNVLCVGTIINLYDTTIGGAWSASNGHATVDGSGNVTGVSSGIDTIYYSVSGSCGTVSVFAIDTVESLYAGTISGTSSVCAGSGTTLTSTVTGGTWRSATPTVATINSVTGVVTGVSAGTDLMSYTTTSACGTASSTYTITVNALPSAGIISGSSSVCVGGSFTLSSTVSGGSWRSVTPAVATINSVTGVVTGISTGADVISYTKTNACGSAYANYSITINTLPTAGTISGSSSVCVGGSFTLSSTVSGGTWSSATLVVASINSVTGVGTGVSAGTDVISYTKTNSCGSAYATYTVTIQTTPVAGTITGSSSVCTGGSFTLTSTVTGGSWRSVTPAVATINSVTGVVTGVSAGGDVISYTKTNACGSAYATYSVTINGIPTITASGSGAICAGGTATLTAAGGTIYSWLPVGSLSAGTGVSVHATPSITTTYTVIGTNASGCSNSAVTTVTVNPIPVISAGTGVSIYLGYSATLTATGGTTYTWAPPATLSSTVGATVFASPTVTTTYTVTGTTAGCSNRAVETVTVTLRPCATPTTTPTTGITTTSAIINWSAVTGSTEYLVAYKLSSGSTWTNLLSTGTSQTLTGLTPGTAYNYKLKTVCGAMDSSGTSAIGTFSTLVTCGTPTTVTATGVSTTTAVIHWSAVTGATNYNLAYKTAAASSWTELYLTGVTTYTLTGLVAATIYQYEVRSVCAPTDSSSFSASSATFITLGGAPTCPTPAGLTSVLSSTVATLSWTAVTGAAGYQVNYQLVSHGTPAYAYTTTNSITLTGLTLSSSYEYKVRTVCVAGDTSSASAYTTFRVIDGEGIASPDPSEGWGVKIYPNPSTGLLYIEAAMKVDAKLSSIDGRLLIDRKDVTEIDMNNLANGIYFINVYDNATGLILKTDRVVKTGY